MTVYLLAHGSVDPRHAQDVAAIAARLAAVLAEHVHPCYLDLCPPRLAEVAEEPQAAGAPDVVVPLLLSPGYHVQVDVGLAVAAAGVPLRVAAPPLLTSAAPWGRDLLHETQSAYPGCHAVFVTAGTRDAAVLEQWEITAAELGVCVVHAGGPGARLAQLPLPADPVVLPLLIGRGFFADLIAEQAAARSIPVAFLAGTSQALTNELAAVVSAARATAGLRS